MRIRAPAVLAGLTLLATQTVTGSGEAGRPTPDAIQRRIDDLFIAAQYDSILDLIPAYIQRAESDGDSVLLGRMYAQRGHVLLVIGRRAEAERDIDIGLRVAEAVRDTVGWMPAIHFKGFVYRSQGRYGDAMRCFEQRLLLAQKVRCCSDRRRGVAAAGAESSVVDITAGLSVGTGRSGVDRRL